MATERMLEAKLKLADIPSMANVAEHLSEKDLSSIGSQVIHGLTMDLASRAEWEERTKRIYDIALQVFQQKSFPWVGASSVKFPIITIAALQYHARAYPALVPSTGVVEYKVFGPDPQGQRHALGKKLSDHMDYQLTEEDENWEDEMDKTLFVQGLLGSAFKKIYYDSVRGHQVSELVLPKDLVISYYATSVEAAPRLSHLIFRSSNEVYEKVQKGLWLDIDLRPNQPIQQDKLTQAKDKASGFNPPPSDATAPNAFVEQHVGLDLDGDGYEEPYVVTVHRQSSRVVRILPRFASSMVEYTDAKKRTVLRIQPIHHFEAYKFIPSPDGSIYGIGLGMLLPLNEAINTLINQLVDAGTLANLGGGFLGRGAKIRSGDNTFKPGEWKNLDSTGEDIAKSVYPLPIRDPSPVLFQLLGMLVQYAERTGSATDPMVGVSPGQNTPAETSRNTLEQGMKVLTGVMKRTYRSLKGEFRKRFILNALYLPESKPDNPLGVVARDYLVDPKGIRPAADPNLMSEAQRMNKALTIKQAAMGTPGYNLYEVEKDFLTAMDVADIDRIYPDPKGPNAIQPQPNPKLMEAMAKTQLAEIKKQDVQAKHKLAAAKLMIEADHVQAKIDELKAKAAKERSEAKSHEQDRKLSIIDRELAISEAKHGAIMEAIQTLSGVMNDGEQANGSNNGGGAGSVAPRPSNQGGNGASPPSEGDVSGALG